MADYRSTLEDLLEEILSLKSQKFAERRFCGKEIEERSYEIGHLSLVSIFCSTKCYFQSINLIHKLNESILDRNIT